MNSILLHASHWKDYALLDSGDGDKLERFGPYMFHDLNHKLYGRKIYLLKFGIIFLENLFHLLQQIMTKLLASGHWKKIYLINGK